MKLCDFKREKRLRKWSSRYAKSKKQTVKQYISEKDYACSGWYCPRPKQYASCNRQGQGERKKRKIYTCLNVHKISLDGYTQKPTTPGWPWEASLGCWGQSRLFHCLCSRVLWELKKKQTKKNQENPQEKVSKFKHVLVLYIHYHVQSS